MAHLGAALQGSEAWKRQLREQLLEEVEQMLLNQRLSQARGLENRLQTAMRHGF